MLPLWWRFLEIPDSVHSGLYGDQSFFLWALERAKTSRGWRDFVINCDWNQKGCLDLRAVPQEWPAMYLIGRIAAFLGARTSVVMSTWYYLSPLFNALGAFYFLGVVTRRWFLSGSLSLLVAFQLSLIYRIRVHFFLVNAWPLFLVLGFTWRALEALEADGKRFVLASAALCSALLVLATASYYYLLFGALLACALTLLYFLLRLPGQGAGKLLAQRRIVVFLAMLALTGAILFVAHRHVFPGGAQGQHQASHHREASDVDTFSPKWMDYLKPNSDSVWAHAKLRKIRWTLAKEDIQDRGEILAFPGLVTLATVMATLAYLILRGLGYVAVHRRLPQRFPARKACLMALVTLVAVLIGSQAGGHVIHRVVGAARCFNRMAPFAVLFAAALVGVAWSWPRWASHVLAILIAWGAVTEYRQYHVLRPVELKPLDPLREDARRLREECQGGVFAVTPPIGDWMYAPYKTYLLAELADCKLDGISGPGFVKRQGAYSVSAPVGKINRGDSRFRRE
ncbi:MAG: hypothetical protein HY698_12955 [Deltaproteobacteria bacterium]|nr:hypothetical protein [Deltaproteobacteria bacterium]